MSTRIIIAGLGLAAAATLAFAGPASAIGTGIKVADPTGSSAKYGTGCSYEVTAFNIAKNVKVTFLDGINEFASAPATDATSVTVKWTPSTTGPHVLTALQDKATIKTDPIDVAGAGIDLGSSCLVF